MNDTAEHVGLNPRIQDLAQLLSRAEHRVTQELSRILEREACTVEQWRALELLAGGGSRSMSEIAEFTLLPAPTLTRLIDRMVADNLAYRKADVRDGRRVLVLITPRGQRLHERLTQRIEREQDGVLGDTNAAELAELMALLARFLRRLGR